MKKNIIYLFIIAIFFSSCSKNDSYEESYFVLGTVVSISIKDHGSKDLLKECFELLDEFEKNMSTSIESSDISLININAGVKKVQISTDTMNVITKGIFYGELSEGIFDISIEPLVKLWNIGKGGTVVPDQKQINEVLPMIDYKKIILDKDTVFIPLGMSLDLGGIAKGYAADQLKLLLESNGVTSAIINIGGNILVLGEKKGNKPFNVGIQDPFDERNSYIGIISLKDSTVVSSGDYERFFELDGQRYHHIFDTKTGYPVITDISSISVITKSSMDADALSTIFFSMDIDKGFKLAEEIGGVSLIYVTKNKDIYISEKIKNDFKLTDSSFKLNVK
ncbi:MAG: FAD:protein FMN transferase [Spirochaetaceae bacterium]